MIRTCARAGVSGLFASACACGGTDPARAPEVHPSGERVDRGEVTTHPTNDPVLTSCSIDLDGYNRMSETVDSAGRLRTRLDTVHALTLAYDDGRLLQVDEQSLAIRTDHQVQFFAYRGDALIVSGKDGKTQSVWDLDTAGRIVGQRRTVDETDTRRRFTWSWNDAGQLASAVNEEYATTSSLTYVGEHLSTISGSSGCLDTFTWTETPTSTTVEATAAVAGATVTSASCTYTFSGQDLVDARCYAGGWMDETWWSHGNDGWITMGNRGTVVHNTATCDFPPKRDAFARAFAFARTGRMWSDPRPRRFSQTLASYPPVTVPVPIPSGECSTY